MTSTGAFQAKAFYDLMKIHCEGQEAFSMVKLTGIEKLFLQKKLLQQTRCLAHLKLGFQIYYGVSCRNQSCWSQGSHNALAALVSLHC